MIYFINDTSAEFHIDNEESIRVKFAQLGIECAISVPPYREQYRGNYIGIIKFANAVSAREQSFLEGIK